MLQYFVPSFPRSAWECLSRRSASQTGPDRGDILPSGAPQSGGAGIPTQSVGTRLGWILIPVISLVAAPVLAGPADPAVAEFFEKEVRPLLVGRCFPCHGDVKTKGGLKLTSQA